jgi:hypothetical protein
MKDLKAKVKQSKYHVRTPVEIKIYEEEQAEQLQKKKAEIYYFEIIDIPGTEYNRGHILEARALSHSKDISFQLNYLNKDRMWQMKSGREVNDMINKGYIKYLKGYKPNRAQHD